MLVRVMAVGGAEAEVGGAKVERGRGKAGVGREKDGAEVGARVAAPAERGQEPARSREHWQQGGKINTKITFYE